VYCQFDSGELHRLAGDIDGEDQLAAQAGVRNGLGPAAIGNPFGGRQSAGPVCDLEVIEVPEVSGVCGDEG
jgi:hypothetical protein